MVNIEPTTGPGHGTGNIEKTINRIEREQWPRFLHEVFHVDVPLSEMVIPENSRHIIVVPEAEKTGTIDDLFQRMLRMNIHFLIRGSSMPLSKKLTNPRRKNGLYVVSHDGLSHIDPKYRMSSAAFLREFDGVHSMLPMEYMILYIFNIWRGVRIDEKTKTVFPHSKVNGVWHPVIGSENSTFVMRQSINQHQVPGSGVRIVEVAD